ncbi:hypothetical protein D3C84_580120 [compost metagenome]
MGSTWAGWLSAKSGVNQREMEASRRSRMAWAPPESTVSMRGFQTSGLPIFAAVLHSTRRWIRAGALIASHWPISPPMDRPQKLALAISSASSRASTSRPSCSML